MRAFRTVMGSAFLPRSRWGKKWAVLLFRRHVGFARCHVGVDRRKWCRFRHVRRYRGPYLFARVSDVCTGGLVALDNPHQRALFFVDAAALVFAVRAGHSSKATANSWIARLFRELPRSFEFMVCHVRRGSKPCRHLDTGPSFHATPVGRRSAARGLRRVVVALVVREADGLGQGQSRVVSLFLF